MFNTNLWLFWRRLLLLTVALCGYLLPAKAQMPGDSCGFELPVNFCPVQSFYLPDSGYTNNINDWGVADMSNAPGKDLFFALNFSNDSAISRAVRLQVQANHVSRSCKMYLLWFEDVCGMAPVEVDSFDISSFAFTDNSVCLYHLLHQVNNLNQRLVIDFSDTTHFELEVRLGYIAVHPDTACYDTVLVNTGQLSLDNSGCSDSLHLPVDTAMVYLPLNMPAVLPVSDAAPNNNGYLITVKKVSSNLGIYNHPFENKTPFAIDTSNQDYCDIILTLFLQNQGGREGLKTFRLQLDTNFNVVKAVNHYGPFFMPTGPGYHNPDGNWSVTYNQPDNKLVWDFASLNGRGDIDGYGPYGCKVYHFGFRAKVTLPGGPFNLRFSMQGDGWGDTTLQQTCGLRTTGCKFCCGGKCMAKPGLLDFGAGLITETWMDIEGNSCLNNVAQQNEDGVCGAASPTCINVATNDPVMLYEGSAGLYKAVVPNNYMVCPDSCRGRISTIDSLSCTQEQYYTRVADLSKLQQYDGQEFNLCNGDTLVLADNDTMAACGMACTTCSSHLVDSAGNAVAFANGKYLITKQGWYYDKHGSSNTPCVTIHVVGASIDISITQSSANCSQVCNDLTAIGDSTLTYTWYDAAGVQLGTGGAYTACHSDTQSITLIGTGNAQCLLSKQLLLQMDSVLSVKLFTDTVLPVTCGGSPGLVDIHASSGTVTYAWSTGATGEDLQVDSAGTYTVTVTNAAGCTDSAQFLVPQQAPFTTAINGVDTVCSNQNALLCASPLGYYQWSTGETTACITVQPKPLVYTVTITDASNCSAAGSFQFALIDSPAFYANITPVRCYTFYNEGAVTLTPVNGVGPYSFNWSTAATRPVISMLTPGNYTVTVADALGCITQDTFTVPFLNLFEIAASPVLDTLRLGEMVPLEVSTTGSNATVFNWQPEAYLDCYTCQYPTAAPPVNWNYTVIGIDANGCSDTAEVKLVVIADYGLFIPNVFTPNGDGRNEVWQVLGNLAAIQKFDLQVFNRWGEKVFESPDYTMAWDGTYKGTAQEPGVYVYQLKVSWKDGHFDSSYKGSLTLFK